ncbi:MAG: PQQ-dependent sugar dehydrogenase [Solirubrobacteraceae bacterium]
MARLLALVVIAVVLTASGAVAADRTVAGAAASKRGLRLVRVGSFDNPVYVTSPRGDHRRVFVVEQGGRVRVLRDGRRLAQPFLDIHDLVTAGGEQGLLSIAFAPDYATSRRFYVYYTDAQKQQRVVEYRAASADRADPASARLVLKMADAESNHNGGLLLFGPDGHPYIGMCDGGGGGDKHGRLDNAQNGGSLLGKTLRIDPLASGSSPYTVPRENPFFGTAGVRSEIYAYGLRNPWRFSFDGKTGDLAIGDVGQNAIEEVDFVRRGHGRGANFGWRVFEGRSVYAKGESAPGAVAPVMTFKHSAGNCSVTGGVVVRDRKVPGAYGRYLFGDFCKGEILSAKLRRPRVKSLRPTGLKVDGLSSFGQDARGRVYAVSVSGPVYRLAAR